MASDYLSSKGNHPSVPDQSAAPSTTAVPATLSASFTIAARNPMLSGSRAPSSRTPAAGSIRSPREFKMALRMRLLLPPASLDVGASGPILCSCGGDLIDPVAMPFHYCLDCASSQFFFIHRYNAVNDALIDLLESTVSGNSLFVTVLPREPLVLPSSHPCNVAPVPSTLLLMPKAGMIISISQAGDQLSSTTVTAASSNGTPGTLAPMLAYIDVAVANPAALTYRPKPAINASSVLIPALPGSSAACFISKSALSKRRAGTSLSWATRCSTHLCALSLSSSKPPAACPATLSVLSSSPAWSPRPLP